ncbi:hypothetical protein TNCV_2973941 [Trichonephila clavipes]|nr:hypothetical protein TNCV_2973941 [Trichonephila clavipes]
MSRSGGQSEAKPPAFSPQVLIYRPTDGIKGKVDLAQPKDRTLVGARYAPSRPLWNYCFSLKRQVLE